MRVRLFTATCCTVVALVASGVVASAQTASPISIHVILYQSSVTAGTTIRGLATLTNSSPRPVIVQACAADGWLYVGLMNSRITYSVSRSTTKCAATVRLKPGVNRFALTVSTSYSACVRTKNSFVPRCTKNGPPPLPKGHYTTSVITIGLPTGTRNPPPIAVTVR